MKIYRIAIKPLSPFGTPLKGDTIFGHFCCQAADDETLLCGGLDHWIQQYPSRPFAVFSSAYPLLMQAGEEMAALPRPVGMAPKLKKPVSRQQQVNRNKADKKKKWLLVDGSFNIQLDADHLKTDEELFDLFLESCDSADSAAFRLLDKADRKLCTQVTQAHNSINRQTMTTGTGMFAPFSHENHSYIPGLELIIFVGVDEDALPPENLRKGFERIGSWGFGRDASTGLGRFSVTSVLEVEWPAPRETDNRCWTLAPSVPQKETFSACHATPFIRFGKHGPALSRAGNPFKEPVVMVDEGAVLHPLDRVIFTQPYLGTAVTNISKVENNAVVQGYSLYLAC